MNRERNPACLLKSNNLPWQFRHTLPQKRRTQPPSSHSPPQQPPPPSTNQKDPANNLEKSMHASAFGKEKSPYFFGLEENTSLHDRCNNPEREIPADHHTLELHSLKHKRFSAQLKATGWAEKQKWIAAEDMRATDDGGSGGKRLCRSLLESWEAG